MMNASFRTIAAVLVLAAAACGGEPPRRSIVPPIEEQAKPAFAQIIAGDQQTGAVAQLLADTLVIAVADESARMVSNAVISWVGDGQPFVSASQTNAGGQARNLWRLGTAAGPQRLEARWIDPQTGEAHILATFHATAQPGPAQAITLALSDTTVFVGQRIALFDGATAADQYGNPTSLDAARITVPAGMETSADTVWATREAAGLITVAGASGNVADQVTIAALLDLRTRSWAADYICRDGPSYMRDNAVIGLDSARWNVRTTQVEYTEPGRVRLEVSGNATFWWRDGVVTQSDGANVWTMRQEAGRLVHADASIALLSEDGDSYQGGTWCPADFRDRGPLTLRAD